MRTVERGPRRPWALAVLGRPTVLAHRDEHTGTGVDADGGDDGDVGAGDGGGDRAAGPR